MDKHGNIRAITGFSQINSFLNGLAMVANADKTRFGYIDKTLNTVIPLTYTVAGDFREGFARVRNNDGNWGYIANPLANPSPWAKNTIDKMFEWGYMTDYISYNYQDNITRREFCIALASAIEKKTNTILPITKRIVFDDTSDINISKLVSAGIIDGVSETEFAPNDYLTREQAAKIFAYMGNNFINWEPISSDAKFIDDADISEWAYESVYLMQANSIIEGYEDGGFRPYIYLTKEQAIAMMQRFLNKF